MREKMTWAEPIRDVIQAAAERMKELNEAYAVLSNGEKRRLYDAYGHVGLEGYTQEDIFRGVDFGSLFHDLGFGGGVFEQFFGGGGRRTSTRQRGDDLRAALLASKPAVGRW